MYHDRGIFLWLVCEVHGYRPRLGVRSCWILTVRFIYGDSQDKVKFIFHNPKKESVPIREWATHSHDGNARLDRTIDGDIIRIQEERNRSDITICHGFFQSTGLMKLSTGGEEPLVNEKRCNNCGHTVKERCNFCTSCGFRLI